MNNARKFRNQFLDRMATDQLFPLFDLLPEVSFFLKDRKGRFVALNQRGCEYCGVATEVDAIGKTDFDFFPTDRATAYHEDDQVVMESGEPVLNRIEASPESIRSPRLVVTAKVPVRDPKGDIIGIAGMSRRVEEFRQSSGEIDRFAKVVDFLHENFGEPITTAELARRAGVSPSQFNRRFGQAFGTSARQYLIRIRIEAAARMLQESDETVATIALDCGFHDHAHFSRSFHRLMRCSPSDYRQKSSLHHS